MPARRDRLRVAAVVLGAVAVLAVVGRIIGPEPPASRPGPAVATTRAPPQRPALPRRGVTARIEVGHRGGPLLFGAGSLWVGALRDREVVRIAAHERDNVTPRGGGVVTRTDSDGTEHFDLSEW